MKHIAAVAMFLLANSVPAVSEEKPPQISWEWYRAGEAYKAYPNRSRNDLLMAAHFHRLAADKGNAASAYKLAEMYENGSGVAKNEEVALKWYRYSAERENKYAELRVGWFQQNGIGTDRDMEAAAQWYQRALDHGNEWGYHMLAFMLLDGNGVPKDVGKARRYFERSLPFTHDNWAQLKLATIIEADDPKRARRLLRQSAGSGNIEALKILKQKGW